MANRKFTRNDIIALFDTKWRPEYEKSHFIVSVENVVLLNGIAPPTWVLSYLIEFEGGMSHSYQVVIYQRYSKQKKQYSLSYPLEIKLPTGCTSVKEENAAIKAEDEENAKRYAMQVI